MSTCVVFYSPLEKTGTEVNASSISEVTTTQEHIILLLSSAQISANEEPV